MVIKLIQPKMAMRPVDTALKTRMAPSLGLFERERTVYREVFRFRTSCAESPKPGGRLSPISCSLFYQKFGKFTGALCRSASCGRTGRLAEWMSRLL